MSKYLFFILIPLLLIAAFLPQIASSPLGKPFFTKAFEKKTGAQIKIGSMSFSWMGPQKFTHLTWSKDGSQGAVEELQIAAPFWSFSGPFLLKNGSIEGGGKISLQGTLLSKDEFQIDVDITQFPLSAISPNLAQMLGPTLNLKGPIIMSQGQGTLNLTASSPTLKANINAHLAKEILTLKEPLLATFIPHLPDLQVQNPISLRIEPDGFSAPFPPSLESINIARATVDLGKVKIKNNRSLATLVGLLKTPLIANAKQIDAWLTPAAFSLQAGKLQLGRIDMLLANSIHICTWGQINLIKDKLDMTLGLPADTLNQAFGLSLPSDYVMTAAIYGSLQEPEIDKGPAAAKIAALIAARQIPKKGILGGIAEIIASPKKEKGVPPAKRPFPWE